MCFGVSLDEEHKLITAIGRYSIVYDFISSSWKRQRSSYTRAGSLIQVQSRKDRDHPGL